MTKFVWISFLSPQLSKPQPVWTQASKLISPRNRASPDDSEYGASLVEILAALLILSLMVTAFLPFGSQVAHHWQAGLTQASRSDQLLRTSIRLQSEIDTILALPVSTAVGGNYLAFEGNPDGFVFVHPQVNKHGIELQAVRIFCQQRHGLFSLVRQQSIYSPGIFTSGTRSIFNGSAVLFDNSKRMQFSFVSDKGAHLSVWKNQKELPREIKISISTAEKLPPLKTTITLTVLAHPTTH